jgi:hypothetical protein
LFKQAIDAINEDLPKFSSDFASTAQLIFLSYYSVFNQQARFKVSCSYQLRFEELILRKFFNHQEMVCTVQESNLQPSD